MTTIIKKVVKNDKEIPEPRAIDASLGDKFLSKLYKQPKTVTVRTWIVSNAIETVVEEKEVKIGTPDVDLKSGKYSINYDAIQNIFGKLIYNTKHNSSNGALRFMKTTDFDVDAKLRAKMAMRDNLHAIWSRWQLPLIVALVAIIASIIAFSLLGLISAQLSTANSCLQDIQCMLGKITAIQAKQEAERLAEEAKANGS